MSQTNQKIGVQLRKIGAEARQVFFWRMVEGNSANAVIRVHPYFSEDGRDDPGHVWARQP